MSHPSRTTPATSEHAAFQRINRAYDAVFQANRLSLGLVVPLERYTQGPVPTMLHHLERVQLAERLGFAAVWLRDVPFNVPSFGDAGQTFDPFVYLGLLAGRTERIALGVASLILPLRHPAHVAKAAASADVLSAGRLLLGIASGDRPAEYPAMATSFEDRGKRFRESYEYLRAMTADFPVLDNAWGRLDGQGDLLPKPVGDKLSLLVTGGSQQDPDWIAHNGDGWMVYPQSAERQADVLNGWRVRLAAADQPSKPAMQPLYVDLVEDPDHPAQPIHLGLRVGARALLAYLESLEAVGMNHVALNLRFNQADIESTLERLAADVLPRFTS